MTVSDVITAYELSKLEEQVFGEKSKGGERLASLLRESIESLIPHIDKFVGTDSLLRQYYILMLTDLRRRLIACKAVVDSCAVVPTTALKRRRELIEPGAQTPLSNPPSSSAKKIKKYNAPRGSEYSPASQTYKGGVKICGKHLILPPTKDPELFVKWRSELLEMAKHVPDDKQAVLEKARQYIVDLKSSVTISSASTEASTGPTSPVSGKPTSTILTPARIAAAASRKLSLTNSPKSAPHRVSLVPSDIDILRFRDKYYCRVSVFGDFISTGMRLSRTEAEHDMGKLSGKLKTYSSYFRNPLVNQFKKAQVVEDVRAFAQTLDGTCSKEPRVPQTEVKQKLVTENTANQVGVNSTLPRGVYKMRDKYYSSVVMFGQTFSTPMRDTVVEVVDDRAAFAEEIQKHKPDLSGEAKNKVIEQVKQYLNERLMGDDFKTPKKSNN
jgi:hypothetical protein